MAETAEREHGMSGHSKWSTIKRKKEAIDGKRGQVFTRIGREIAVAVKEGGGGDPNTNGRLREAIAKAKANNVPNDNIERAIKKAVGDGDRNTYESLMYEGYGPGGVAVMVEALTDNRNRTAADLRHYFDKCGGNLGQTGSVAFMFNYQGLLLLDGEGLTEDQVMEDALLDGVTDINFEDGTVEILTEPAALPAVRDALSAKGYRFESAGQEYLPTTTTVLTDPEAAQKMQKLLDMLEENDDVQNFWHSWEMPDEE